MTHTSPCSYLVWSTMTALVGAFLIFHLWSFDRFKCIRWNNGPNNGAFKRIMTYSYLISVPLIFTYAMGMTIIKYREGFIAHPQYGIIPKPHQLWDRPAHDAIFPLMLVFSIAWGLEMVTHLEELCFWLFLVNSGSSQQDWFRSLYFRTWIGGSVVAVIYMPLVTILTRDDPLKSEAYTFLAGSIGSLSLTLWFTPILWTFSGFLDNLRREGVDTSTIVRLTKFSELNTIRVVFRYLFTVPLLILGVDGVRPHHHVNEKMWATDVLVVLAGFGCAVSSAITLVIFFPRSIEGEIATADAKRERRRARKQGINSQNTAPSLHLHREIVQDVPFDQRTRAMSGETYLLTSSPVKQNINLPVDDRTDEEARSYAISLADSRKYEDMSMEQPSQPKPITPLRPNRRRGGDVEMAGMGVLTEENLSLHNLHHSNVNHMVSHFTSPIDFGYQTQKVGYHGNGSRLTFTQK